MLCGICSVQDQEGEEMKEKTLSDTVYEGRSFHIGHVADAVKKLKGELEDSYIQGLRNWVMRNSHQGYVTEKGLQDFIHNRLRECFREDIDKIFGEFNHIPSREGLESPQETKINSGDSGFESQPEDNHAQEKKGCGKLLGEVFSGMKCGIDGLCPECEVGK